MSNAKPKSYFTNLIGKRFGYLIVLKIAKPKVNNNGRKFPQLLCLCNCGKKKIIQEFLLRIGKTRSCGCFNIQRIKVTKTKHGDASNNRISPEYRAWKHMKARCNDLNDISFYLYGERNIKVCKRWQNNYQNFLDDMGRKPSPKHSLDRINNNGNYEPKNCKWSNAFEQMNNRRPYSEWKFKSPRIRSKPLTIILP